MKGERSNQCLFQWHQAAWMSLNSLLPKSNPDKMHIWHILDLRMIWRQHSKHMYAHKFGWIVGNSETWWSSLVSLVNYLVGYLVGSLVCFFCRWHLALQLLSFSASDGLFQVRKHADATTQSATQRFSVWMFFFKSAVDEYDPFRTGFHVSQMGSISSINSS